jgi:hypothetical protein
MFEILAFCFAGAKLNRVQLFPFAFFSFSLAYARVSL